MPLGEESLAAHRKWRGKVRYASKVPLHTAHDLSLAYTPGVAAACRAIAADPGEVRALTGVGNLVAVITDGSAVLGLGDIGPAAALPVMEGKCAIFRTFAGVDAIPIALGVRDPEAIVAAITAIAPSFGGINLEDISAPRCFAIEQQLQQTLPIPVMHDDQHGTAIAALAGIINALRLTNREAASTRAVVMGAGAGGLAVAWLLHRWGVGEVALVDSQGLVAPERAGLNPYKREAARWSGQHLPADGRIPSLGEVVRGTDVLLGLSVANLVDGEMVRSMAARPIVMAMANPDPEIMPEAAQAAGAAIVATGRSDYPNQINNAIAYPGVFRGLLDAQVRAVSDGMKTAAAEALAAAVADPRPDIIVPSLFEPGLAQRVADAVIAAARAEGLAAV